MGKLLFLFIFSQICLSQPAVDKELAHTINQNKIRSQSINSFLKESSKDGSSIKKAHKFLFEPNFCPKEIYKIKRELEDQTKIETQVDLNNFVVRTGNLTSALAGCSGLDEGKIIDWLVNDLNIANQPESAIIIKNYLKLRLNKMEIDPIEFSLTARRISKLKETLKLSSKLVDAIKKYIRDHASIKPPVIPNEWPKSDIESMKSWAKQWQLYSKSQQKLVNETKTSLLENL